MKFTHQVRRLLQEASTETPEEAMRRHYAHRVAALEPLLRTGRGFLQNGQRCAINASGMYLIALTLRHMRRESA